VLEWERLAREEALGRLQQERTTLEGAQATLKQQEDEVSKLNQGAGPAQHLARGFAPLPRGAGDHGL
jgi:hypothetical protein